MSLVTVIAPINSTDDFGFISHVDINLHDCLTDDADWNAEYWDFATECMDRFVETIKHSYASSSKGIVFQALWVGEEPTNNIEATLEQIVNILLSNKVGTKSRYVISKHA